VSEPLEKYLVLQRYTRYLQRNREAIDQLKGWLGRMRRRRPVILRFHTSLEPAQYRDTLAVLQARIRSSREIGRAASAGLVPHELTAFLAWPPRPLPPDARQAGFAPGTRL